MKIISNFDDYYDYIFGIYYEKGKAFKRNLEAISITREEHLIEKEKSRYCPNCYDGLGNSFNHAKTKFYFLSGALIFCEELYNYIIIIDLEKLKYDVFYEFTAELEKIIKKADKYMGYYNSVMRNSKNYLNKDLNKIDEKTKEEHKKYNATIINKLDHYIDLPKEIFKDSRELKELYNLPMESVNTPLKLLKFYNIMTPQKVYQEITMYLSVLDNKENNTCIIEDKYRIKAKGFDEKSFRKGKGTKRGKKASQPINK